MHAGCYRIFEKEKFFSRKNVPNVMAFLPMEKKAFLISASRNWLPTTSIHSTGSVEPCLHSKNDGRGINDVIFFLQYYKRPEAC